MSRRVNRDEIDRFHEYKLYVPARTIYMGSESCTEDSESGVDALMAERFLKNLLILDTTSGDPITVIMNNVGGEESHGLAIYDAIKSSRCKITVKVFGQASSMGSVILQAADKRLMAPNAKQMIHYGSLTLSGHTKTVQKTVQDSEKMDRWMERMYLARIREKHPNYAKEALEKLLDHDTYLTAKESVAMGLADKVLSEK